MVCCRDDLVLKQGVYFTITVHMVCVPIAVVIIASYFKSICGGGFFLLRSPIVLLHLRAMFIPVCSSQRHLYDYLYSPDLKSNHHSTSFLLVEILSQNQELDYVLNCNLILRTSIIKQFSFDIFIIT